MNSEAPVLSANFQRLYGDAAVYQGMSRLFPIDFTRVLPFQAEDLVADHVRLLAAETAHLAAPNEATRLGVLEGFGECGLLMPADVANLKPVVDFFDADFFELMGEVYANAGMFICALRWYREMIAELELRGSSAGSDIESVYAGVGHCLYALGLFPEAIAWSRSCIGPRQTADTVSRALLNYEAQLQGGCLQSIERSWPRTRYTVSAFDPDHAGQLTQRLKLAMETFAPFQEVYIGWTSSEKPSPEIQAEGYPFCAEYDAGSLVRHRMNLIFSLASQADELSTRGHIAEAKRLLQEAALLEPQAAFIRERLATMP